MMSGLIYDNPCVVIKFPFPRVKNRQIPNPQWAVSLVIVDGNFDYCTEVSLGISGRKVFKRLAENTQRNDFIMKSKGGTKTNSFHTFQISLSHRVLVLGGTQTHQLLIFGQTPKPSCQEDSWTKRIVAYSRFCSRRPVDRSCTGSQNNWCTG